MLRGPNFAATEEVARISRLKIIASGGVSSLDDIRKLKTLVPLGVEGLLSVRQYMMAKST